jgi:hypothetical protein
MRTAVQVWEEEEKDGGKGEQVAEESTAIDGLKVRGAVSHKFSLLWYWSSSQITIQSSVLNFSGYLMSMREHC